jgi:hypothetical protein
VIALSVTKKTEDNFIFGESQEARRPKALASDGPSIDYCNDVQVILRDEGLKVKKLETQNETKNSD